jgi:TatD DNase family protein
MSDSVKELPAKPEPLSVEVMDSHCHLDISDGLNVDDAIEMAKSVGVSGIMQVGCDVASSEWSVKIAEEVTSVLASVAIHPNEAPVIEKQFGREGLLKAIERIAELAQSPRVRAIGETGLDYFRTETAGLVAQEFSFREHIQIANSLNKPVMVHDRDAHEDVLRILLEEKANQVVFHCYSADAEFAKKVIGYGWYLSFAGTVTFKNAPNLREALKVTPIEQILVETDAPFLTPMPYRGQPNASYLIPITLRFMATELAIEEDVLAEAVKNNFLRVFGSFE